MLFKQLLYFNAVAETLNISHAAKKLFISQPPISRQIMLLEKELGVKLFVRKNKGLELTEPGLILQRHAKELLGNVDALLSNVKEEAHSFRGTLKLGVIPSGMPYLMEKLKIYKKKYPAISLHLRSDTPDVLLEELEKGNLHAVFLRNFIHHNTGFSELTVANDPLEIILHKSLDPAKSKKHLTFKQLKNLPLCTLRPNDTWKYSELFFDECRKRKVQPLVLFECNDTPSIMQLVRTGMAASFLPLPLKDTITTKGEVYSKPVEGLNLSSPLTMVYTGSTYMPTCLRLFLHLIKSSLSAPTFSNKSFE